jgi:N-acyl-D-amino-acid deacylase
MERPSRRSVLLALGAAASGLAGCSSGGDDPTASADGATTTPVPTTVPPATSPPTATPSPTATATETASEQAPTDRPAATPTTGDLPATGPPTDGVAAFDEAVPGLLDEWGLPGCSVAAMRGERLVFARGYGYAGPDTADPFRPGNLCRLGSISKPVTAVAVLDLVERGALALDDRVVDLLADMVPDGGPADPRAEDVTVAHLLRHTAGFDDAQFGFDPVFAPRRVADEMDADPPASAETTVTFALTRDLAFEPGTDFAYTNTAYCVLGRVVEAVADADYETHVRDRLLGPLGADRMHVGATRRENLRDDEVRYMARGTVQSPFPGEDGSVPGPYGAGVLDEALDADGGWVGSAVDLLRFVRGVDGQDGVADVLSPETRETMLARPPVDRWEGADQYYATGWYVTETESGRLLWHNGSVPGSYGFLVRFADDDLTVAALFNGRSADRQLRQFNVAAQRTVLETVGAVDSWPDRDLFDEFD